MDLSDTLISESAEMKSYMMATIAEKVPCELKDHRQQGPVRVKGGMSLRNGMWHGLQNDIIMWNVIYMQNNPKKYIKLKSAPFFAPINLETQPLFQCCTMTIKNPRRLIVD